MLNRSEILIAVVGPTAIGKTSVALELVELLQGNAEILSSDSVQIYRRLDVGSAKPTAAERKRAHFHLIDIVEPDQAYTLADYQRDAMAAYDSARAAGNATILCGGTGLYVRALTRPLGIPRVNPDTELRAKWSLFAAENGAAALHQVLAERDPATAERLHVNDIRRIVRAIEVVEHTGRRLSDWHLNDQSSGAALLPGVMLFGLNRDRSRLYEAIDSRVAEMMTQGFEDEVAELRAAGYARTLHSMRSLGYNEMNAYLDGETTLAECVESIKLHTRQFARRQLIWFRADPSITWIDTEGEDAPSVANRIMSLVTQKSEVAKAAENSRERIT